MNYFKIVSLFIMFIGIMNLPCMAKDASDVECNIFNIESLHTCFREPRHFKKFIFTSDIHCGSIEECCPRGVAPLLLQDLDAKLIDGNNHTFRRDDGQRSCPVVVIRNSRNITLRRLHFDEFDKIPPCELSEQHCPSTIDIAKATDIYLDNIHIYDGKGYVVKVWETNGFTLSSSTISEAGIIGLYIGHYRYGPTTNVTITESVFARSRANALALQGAYSSDETRPVLITRNIFVDNHWHGLWPIPGGVTTGGQVLVGDGKNIHIIGNIFSDSSCLNCFGSRHVAAVEIGEVASPPAGVDGIMIDDNIIVSREELASVIRQNVGSSVTAVAIANNRITAPQPVENVRTRVSPNAEGTVPLDQVPFARTPRPGANGTPLFLCSSRFNAADVFTSTLRNCGDKGDILDILGFSAD